MNKTKIKWFVMEAPRGKWKSFERRGWPTAETADGRMIARIECADDYSPRRVAAADHGELTVFVADWRGGLRAWNRIINRATCLSEAKAMVKRFYDENPEWLPEPKEVTP